MKHPSLTLIREFASLILGAVILAIAYALFIAPLNIVPGGVYGISIVVNHLTHGLAGMQLGVPIGTIALFFNVPLFFLAFRSLGRLSAIKTFVTFVLVALFTDLATNLNGGKALVEGETILCSFYGGALLGLGVWLIFRAGGSCAGTDTLARVLASKTNIKVSSLIILIDSIVVLLGLVVFGDWKIPLYSWITIFVYGKVVEILQPQNPHKAVFIISDKPQELRDALVGHMGVRGTFLHGRGMYMGIERKVIFIIIERKHLLQLKTEVLAIDPRAFISTSDATNDSTPPLLS